MGETTGIAWTDSTFNPWIGCTKVGPGCDHCYAETQDSRKRWGGVTHWGAGTPRHRTKTWSHPVAWNKSVIPGKPHRVFCASLADVFDNEVPDEWRYDLFKMIKATPNLTWQLVTKRIGNVSKMLPADWGTMGYPNVWIIATIVCEDEWMRDGDKLLGTPAWIHGVSYEPALGLIDWAYGGRLPDWIIIGGESRQGSFEPRPFDNRWAYNTIDQCRQFRRAAFVKQLGSAWAEYHNSSITVIAGGIPKSDRTGSNMEAWAEELRVREFPA